LQYDSNRGRPYGLINSATAISSEFRSLEELNAHIAAVYPHAKRVREDDFLERFNKLY